MSAAETTPVLVGVGTFNQRIEDPTVALEPIELMQRALTRAGEDAEAPGLLSQADSIWVPRGFWNYPDPGRWLAESLGASGVRTHVSEIGVLQSTLLGRAACEIASGSSRIVLITGGEAKYRSLRASITGTEATFMSLPEIPADETLRPENDVLHPLEIKRGAVLPVRQYAMIENALRAEEGLSLADHRDEVARLWSAMSEVAARNPNAWDQNAVSADLIRNPSERNPMLAFPYTKFHNSQWNVDQAAGLILCSAQTAQRAGVPESKWIYPWVNTESNHMVNFTERAHPDKCPGFAIAGHKAFEYIESDPSQVAHREIYSCFPSAVRMQLRELGIDPNQQLTETGGMRFAGGPLNNFVLQATVRMAQTLRQNPGQLGLVTAVSGVLTKQGVMVYSAESPNHPFSHQDVTSEVERISPKVPLTEGLQGEAEVVAYTVTYKEEQPDQAILLCQNDAGERTLALSSNRDLMEAMTQEEFCGRVVQVAGSDVP